MARTWGATRAKFWDVDGAWPGTAPKVGVGARSGPTPCDAGAAVGADA